MTTWRLPTWEHIRSIYFEQHPPKPPYYKTRQNDYEAGADALLGALKVNGNYMEWEDIAFLDSGLNPQRDGKTITQHRKGWLVLIPDDDNKEEK